jgi:Branched-chain amino acid aminotransferase/4-amino-4-deoxychorismate lyase
MSFSKNYKSIINDLLIPSTELPNFDSQNQLIIYEVVRIINKRVLFLEDHIQRFFDSFNLLRLKPVITSTEILEKLLLLIESNQVNECNIKFQVVLTNNSTKQDFYAFIVPHSYPTDKQYKTGVTTSILNALRLTPNAKTLQSAVREASNKIILEKKVYEVILVNQKDFVTEGSRTNLFMIKDNIVISPRAEDILPGITRKHVLQVCSNLKIKPIEKDILLTEMLTMDCLFLSGTSPKVLPINSVDNYSFDVNHPLLRKIMTEFDELIEKYLKLNTKFL